MKLMEQIECFTANDVECDDFRALSPATELNYDDVQTVEFVGQMRNLELKLIGIVVKFRLLLF